MRKTLSQISLWCCLVSAIGFSQSKQDPIIVGADRDSHGCIGSAGYTYSEIKEECIRLFEEKIQLKEVHPTGTATANAVVILSKNKNKAEVFVPNTSESLILVKKIKKGKKIWKKGSWTLQNTNGYILKKDSKIIFKEK